MHDEERDHRRERRDLLFRLCHTDRNADRKDDRQIAEDRAARTRHDREQRVQRRPRTEDTAETVRLDRRRVRERRADAEQDTCNRQDRDRQHEAAPDALEYTKDLIFHNVTPFPLPPSSPCTPSPLGNTCKNGIKKVVKLWMMPVRDKSRSYKIMYDNYTVDREKVSRESFGIDAFQDSKTHHDIIF